MSSHAAVDGATTGVDQLILDHLETADLPKDARELVFAALLGEAELRELLDGEAAPSRPQPLAEGAGSEPAGAYFSHIAAQGFRGIGEPAVLELVPGHGLTIVTRRNGSGKSSFAEAAELALTGDNRRWAGRTQEWRDGWRNLHKSGERYVRVGLGLDGHRGGATVERRWEDGDDLDGGVSFLQRAGEPRRPVADLGWQRPLELYRPFLSYSELGGLLSGRPSERHDSLHSVLGLGRLTEVEDLLKGARRDSDATRRAAGDELPTLREALAAHPDPRARGIERQLADADPNLDQVDQMASGAETGTGGSVDMLRAIVAIALPDREEVTEQVEELRAAQHLIAELAATPADEARSLAGLLREAIDYHHHHPDQPCPVCGGRTLDDRWAQQARTQVERLTERAERLERAHGTVRESCRRLRELVPAIPPVLRVDLADDAVDPAAVRTAGRDWDELLRSDEPAQIAATAPARFDTVTLALSAVQAAAGEGLEHRQRAWQPVAEQVRGWTQTARGSRRAADMHKASRKAVDWLRGVGERIRNERLAPLATEATEIWGMLRQDSSVDLGTFRLAPTTTGSRPRSATSDSTPTCGS